MKHHVSQNRQPLRRTITYAFMTLMVVMIVTIMTLLVLGYSFNRNDGRIEQGGLLQFASSPTGADVTIDGELFGSDTNTKATVFSGVHDIKFDKTGYHTWTKSIAIKPGQVGWLNYARMVPTNLEVETVQTIEKVDSTSMSPGRNFMLVHPDASSPVYSLIDVRSEEPKITELELPEAVYTQSNAKQEFAVRAWSSNEDSILIEHTYGQRTEWLILDRDEPAQSANINDMFEITPKKVVYADNSERLLFVQTGDVVRRIDVTSENITQPFASNIDTFSSFNDATIVYTSLPNELGARSAGYASLDLLSQQIIRTFNDTKKPFFAAMGEYFNNKHIAVIRANELIVDVGTLPTPSNNANFKRLIIQTITPGAKNLSFSENGRFVVIEYADKFAVYDIELNTYDETKWRYPASRQQPLKWLDNYVVLSDNGGQLRIYDFDGANQFDLMEVTEGLSGLLSPDGKYVYGLLKTSDGFELRRVQLLI